MGSDAEARNILVAAFGLTPQVITETLYYLTQVRKPPTRIDEIHVITTALGRQQVLDVLLADGKGKFYQFCSEYDIDADSIEFSKETISLLTDAHSRALSDIRTAEENRLAADQIVAFVRRLASDPDVTLHCSVAGGRKTMGIYLAYALQLFGRPQDTLFHVLVSEELESHPEFFYKSRQNKVLVVKGTDDSPARTVQTKDARIELAEIPYIRLRDKLETLFGAGDMGYTDMVSVAQRQINLLPTLFDLEIKLEDRNICIGDKCISLQPLQMVIYTHYARNKLLRCRKPEAESCQGCTRCFIPFRETSREEMLAEMLDDYRRTYGGNERVVERLKARRDWESGIPVEGVLRPNVSKINRIIKRALTDPLLSAYYTISSEGQYGNVRYGLKIDKAKLRLNPGV